MNREVDGLNKFYNFINNNPDAKKYAEQMNDLRWAATESFVSSHVPEQNTNLYYESVMRLSGHPNGLKDLQLQTTNDGVVASGILEKYEKNALEAQKLSQQVDTIKNYIGTCRHDDLRQNYGCIPESEKDSTIRKAVQQYGDTINSSQLRDFMYKEAMQFYQKTLDIQSKGVHIKTSHAERLDDWDR